MQPNHVARATLSPMRILQRLIGAMRRPMAERHAKGKALTELAGELKASGEALDARFAQAPDSGANREALAHWIGIERWGQRRLQVALGEPLVIDAYHGYRPDKEQGMAHLRDAFAQTRADTLALIDRLQDAGVDPATTVRHNDLGDLSVAGWLAYLLQHPEQESKGRLRGA